MSANATIKPGRELERVGRALHAGALRFPNLSTSGLRDLATLARWLAAVFDAKVEARSAPFPASLPPWLVMQWLPLREVAAALRVAWSWRLDSEHYFRVFVERHRNLASGAGGGSLYFKWENHAMCHMQMQRSGRLTEFQEQVFRYYRAFSWVRDDRFIPIGDAIAAVRLVIHDATAEQVKTAVANLVSLHKLRASTTGNQHRAVFEVGGLDDLSPLQQCVLKYHIVYGTSDEGCHVHDVAAHFGTDLSLVRAAVDFLEGEDYLIETIDEDHYDYAYYGPRRWAKYYSSADLA